jgi:hypothetical protein
MKVRGTFLPDRAATNMPKTQPDLFSLIFSDARVFDVDFSDWDKVLRFGVVGADVRFPIPKRLPLFVVEFQRPSRFVCEFRHLGVRLEKPSHHVQWNIEDFEKTKTEKGVRISLIGAKPSPNVEVECEQVEIRPLEHSVVDQLFPGWGAPYSSLARRGIEDLAKLRGKGQS